MTHTRTLTIECYGHDVLLWVNPEVSVAPVPSAKPTHGWRLHPNYSATVSV